MSKQRVEELREAVRKVTTWAQVATGPLKVGLESFKASRWDGAVPEVSVDSHGMRFRISFADLSGVDLRGVDLSLFGVFNCLLRGADLRGVALGGAGNCDFTEASLERAHLNSKREVFSHNILVRADLRGAFIGNPKNSHSQTMSSYIDFTDANLASASFYGTGFTDCRFVNADLSDSFFKFSDIRSCRLAGANFSGAAFNGTGVTLNLSDTANFTGAMFLDGGYLYYPEPLELNEKAGPAALIEGATFSPFLSHLTLPPAAIGTPILIAE